MNRFAIITDTNSGIMPAEAAENNIYLIDMPFIIDGKVYYENRELSYDAFFDKLGSGADVSTSQPSPVDITGMWDHVLKENEKAIYIPMSSGLSGTCATAKVLAQEYDGRILVADNKRISVTLRAAVNDAIKCRTKGFDAAETLDYLEKTGLDSDVFVAVNTLEYLKKGGRITPAAAAIGSVLGIKPVLRIHGERLDAYKKVRGMKSAMEVMADAVSERLKNDFSGQRTEIRAAFSGDRELGETWRQTVAQRFDGMPVGLDALPVSISCHVGAGALGIGISKIL